MIKLPNIPLEEQLKVAYYRTLKTYARYMDEILELADRDTNVNRLEELRHLFYSQELYDYYLLACIRISKERKK